MRSAAEATGFVQKAGGVRVSGFIVCAVRCLGV